MILVNIIIFLFIIIFTFNGQVKKLISDKSYPPIYLTKMDIDRSVSYAINQLHTHFLHPNISKLINKTNRLPIQKRIEIFSQQFKGKHYQKWPLGEGYYGEYDKSPLYRFDQFDCTTFIETVIALASSTDFLDFEKKIKKVRYKNGVVSFLNRNHFISVDWIPNNISSQLIVDITKQIGSKQTIKRIEIVIDKKKWFQSFSRYRIKVSSRLKQAQFLKEIKQQTLYLKPQNTIIPYIDLEALFADTASQEILNKIPSGSIINILKSDENLFARINSNINVTHQGFCIRKHGIPYFRHATSSRYKQVIDVPLAHYLKYFLHSDLLGINILAVKEPFIDSLKQLQVSLQAMNPFHRVPVEYITDESDVHTLHKGISSYYLPAK